MKSPEEQQNSMAKLNENDLIELRSLQEEIGSLAKKEINVENLFAIENVCRSLNAFREKYQYRIINLLKGGWIA